MDRVIEERRRCARLCEGIMLAIEIGAGKNTGWSAAQCIAARATAEWLRDEIMRDDKVQP